MSLPSTSSTLKWDQILDDPEDCDYGSDSEEIKVYSYTEEEPYRTLSSVKASVNCCRTPCDEEKIEDNMANALSIISTVDFKKPTSCIMNEVQSCCTVILNCHDKGAPLYLMYNAVDVYLRSRHELLHSLAMSCIGVDVYESDFRFCDLLPITSERTPDYIKLSDNLVTLIETTATTDVEKAFFSKGVMEFGYKPKYDLEISELNDIGFDTHYKVFIFNIKNTNDSDYRKPLSEAATLLRSVVNEDKLKKLEAIRRMYCDITNSRFSILNKYLTDLFSTPFTPNRSPVETLEFLTVDKGEDDEFYFVKTGLSLSTYNKLISTWPRLPSMLEFMHNKKESTGYKLRLELTKNRFQFVSGKGPSYDEWQYALSMNDRVLVVNNVYLTVTGDVFNEPRTDIEHFYISEKTAHVEQKRSTNFSIGIHVGSAIHRSSFDFNPYTNLIKNDIFKNKKPKYLDREYQNDLETKMVEMYSRINTEEELDAYLKKLKNKKTLFFKCAE